MRSLAQARLHHSGVGLGKWAGAVNHHRGSAYRLVQGCLVVQREGDGGESELKGERPDRGRVPTGDRDVQALREGERGGEKESEVRSDSDSDREEETYRRPRRAGR